MARCLLRLAAKGDVVSDDEFADCPTLGDVLIKIVRMRQKEVK